MFRNMEYEQFNSWRKVDYRIESLKHIINALEDSNISIWKRAREGGWYDGGWALEESEALYGIALIAMQNYINGSIKDIFNSSKEKHRYYQLGTKITGYNMTEIELIIGLANYSKHVDDDGPFHPQTKQTLEHFNLRTNKEFDIDNSPIYKGLELLNNNSDLFELVKIVKEWRKKILEEK